MPAKEPDRSFDPLSKLKSDDFIMDPSAGEVLQEYLEKRGGDTHSAIDALSKGYRGRPQICNTIMGWLKDLDCDKEAIDCMEQSVAQMILRCFNPDLADAHFSSDSTSSEWMQKMIQHGRWRKVLYELVDRHPSSVLLSFAVRIISDAGFQSEITNVNSATQQIEIFSRILASEVKRVVDVASDGENSTVESIREAMESLTTVMIQNEHTFIYSSALLEKIGRDNKEPGVGLAALAIIESVRECMTGKEIEAATLRCAMKQSIDDEVDPEFRQSLLAMLTSQRMNVNDLNNVYQQYLLPRPPPVALIRDTNFLKLLFDGLLSPEDKEIDCSSKLVYLLAYATTVAEKKNSKNRKVNCQFELENARSSLSKTIAALNGTYEEIGRELPDLIRLGKIPVVSATILWFYRMKAMAEGARLNDLPMFFHVLFDAIVTQHRNLHSTCLEILDELYHKVSHEEDVAEFIMSRQKLIIDRWIHLFASGSAIRVLQKMSKMFNEAGIDASLIRYFLLEVLDIIGPPYSPDLARLLVPLVSDIDIIDEVQRDKLPIVSIFLEEATPLLLK